MTPVCPRCSYLASLGQPPLPGCPACRRALVFDVAFSPAYRGLPLDRLAAVLVAVAAGVVALLAARHEMVSGIALAVLALAACFLFSRRRPFEGCGRRRVFRRVNPPGAAGAPAASGDRSYGPAGERRARTHART